MFLGVMVPGLLGADAVVTAGSPTSLLSALLPHSPASILW